MSNEIATYSMILSKLSLGKSGTECPTKTQILAINSLIVIDNASTYGANECVKIDDIRKKAEPTIEYVFSINPWQVEVGSSGGSGSITIISYKLVNHNQIKVGYNIDRSFLPSWATYNSSDNSFTISANTTTSERRANVYFEQEESGKRDYAIIIQAAYVPPADNYVFVWAGNNSTADQTLNLPYTRMVGSYTVTSTKNGSNQSWSVSSSPSWISTTTSSNNLSYTASENTGSARSGKVVLTQSGSGKTLTINVSQDAKPAEDEYTFEIRKSDEEYTGKTSITFDVPASTVGWSGNFAYRSRKNGEQFANVSFSSSASWIHVESSGTYTVYHNTGSSSRSGTITLTQAESGLKCYIYINQSGYTPTYTFNVFPTILSVTAAETNETLTVESYKTVLKSDGSETTQSLDYEFSSNNSWVAAARTTTNATYITVAENKTTTQRTAKITLTQAESGAQAFTNVIQAGKAEEVVNKLTLNSLTHDNCYLFLAGTVPVESNNWSYLMFMADTSLNWYASRGITVNGGTAYAGNLVNIYVYSSGSYKLVKSFQLQLGEQTVTY